MTQIQFRRDTSTNWTTNNPTPASGEPCYETDTGKLKIGDGATSYNDLEYIGGDSSDPSTIFEAVDVENNNSLDSFTTGGIYYFTSSTTNANKPIDGISGVLEVIPKGSGDRLVQRFTRVSATYNGCWVRTALNTTGTLVWEEWENLVLPPATADTLGGIKVGTNLTITEDGVLSNSINTTDFATSAQGTNADNAVAALNEFKFWKGTSTEYNAIETKDENTLYVITG